MLYVLIGRSSAVKKSPYSVLSAIKAGPLSNKEEISILSCPTVSSDTLSEVYIPFPKAGEIQACKTQPIRGYGFKNLKVFASGCKHVYVIHGQRNVT